MLKSIYLSNNKINNFHVKQKKEEIGKYELEIIIWK